jgi:hypothetical protein
MTGATHRSLTVCATLRALRAAALAACFILAACTDRKEPSPADGPAAARGDTTRGDTAARAPHCYRSDGPILTRLASDSQEASTVGWLRLDDPLNIGGGTAQLLETGGAFLDARWTRQRDTLVLEGADDFVRITARLVEQEGVLQGEAHAFSDAQLEPGPGGDLVPAERRWRLVAERADCGDAPRPWTAVEQATFDPARLREGDTVGRFRAESVAVVWADAVGEWTGSVTFGGRVWLSGATIRHHDYPEVPAACFEADAVSGRKLPRWPGDERRPWFCFENDSAARRLLGAPDSVGRAEILIDRFTTVRAFTDAVNSARLVSARRARPGD